MNKFLVSLIIFSISFIINAQDQRAPENQVIDKVVAVVGNQAILQSEIDESYFQFQARGMQTNSNQKCEIFENLLFQKLLIVQALIDSVEVLDKQVDAEIDSELAERERQLAPTSLEEYLGKSRAEIKESLFDSYHDQLVAKKMRGEIVKDIKVTPSDVKKYFSNIPKDSLPILDATYELAQIVKKPQMTVAEKQAQRDKLTAIRDRIVKKGEDFKTLAVLYSDDPGSARKGGLMEDVSRGDLVPEFAQAVFNLDVDEVSDIVDTEYGIHIIKLIARHGDKVDFRHILFMPSVSTEAKMKAKNELDSIANVIRTDTLTFGQAALKFSDDKDTRLNDGRMVNPYTGDAEFEAKQIEPSINFVLRNLKVGEISDAFEAKEPTGLPTYKIIYLIRAKKAHTVNIKEDYQMIQNLALQQKQQGEVNKWVEDKVKDTYIKIDPAYKNCSYNFKGWNK